MAIPLGEIYGIRLCLYINSYMIHKHHIIPKHAGGLDNESNLIELTVEEHAEAHRVLFDQYGQWQDKCAWLGLSGQISRTEIDMMVSEETKRKMSIAKSGENHPMYGKKTSDEVKKKISDSTSGKNHYRYGNTVSNDTKEKISKSLMGKITSEETKQKMSESSKGKVWDANSKSGVSGTSHWSWVAHTYG